MVNTMPLIRFEWFSQSKEAKAVPTELDAIVEKAREVFDGLHIHQVASPGCHHLKKRYMLKIHNRLTLRIIGDVPEGLTTYFGLASRYS